MFDSAVIQIGKEKFSGYAQVENYGNIAGITVKNRRGALRKIVKRVDCKHFIINHNQEDERLFERKIKRYNNLSIKTVLPIIDKVCRLTAEKYKMTIPLEEIYITADEEYVFDIVRKLSAISRLFSIVCDNCDINISDRLYFEYGCVSRRINTFDRGINKDSIIIRAGGKNAPFFSETPIIDITSDKEESGRVVSALDIVVTDEKAELISKLWGGKSGLFLYELLGIVPDENAKIDINKTADPIFLLDTEAF